MLTGVPIRDFTDAAGVHWQVWSTIPATAGGVAGGFRLGWLTFNSPEERRRLAPIPVNWELASDTELQSFFRRAAPVKQTPPGGIAAEPDRRSEP